MTFLITTVVSFFALLIGMPIFLGLIRLFGWFTVVQEK